MQKKHKAIAICCAATPFIVVSLLAASRVVCSRPPQPQDMTPEQIVEYLASERFAKMAPDDKRQYVEAIRVSSSKTPVLTLLFNPRVSQDQRRRAMDNILPAIGPVIDERVDEFDRLPAAEQTVRLDALIDQMQASRRDHPGGAPSPERLSLILQYIDPHTRAKIRKHIPALRARMKERGIPVGFPF